MLKRFTTITLAIAITVYPLLFVQAASVPKPIDSKPLQTGLSPEQIDNLMAPIALYPDPLLAQILPASTFVEQIDQAARYLRSHNNQSAGVEDQSWDISVKSIAHYPDVVFSMSEKLDWTTAVGQVYVSQTADVFNSIQRLRKKAKDYGYLKTTPQQTVVEEKDIIKIVPAQPQYIYVPQYNPQVVYVAAPSTYPTGAVVASAAIAFTSGLLIGAWLNNDCNWHAHAVYYHGWHGAGWISHSATVVHWNNSYYVNSRYSTVRYNTAVIHRNVNYNNVTHYNSISRNINYNNVNRNVNYNVNRNLNVNNVSQVNVNRNNVNNLNLNRNINSTIVDNGAYRGRGVTASTSASQVTTRQQTSGFGSYGNAAQTRAQSVRGQASRSSVSATTSSRTSRVSGGRRRL
jgi:hypothetical protein